MYCKLSHVQLYNAAPLSKGRRTTTTKDRGVTEVEDKEERERLSEKKRRREEEIDGALT